MLSSIKRNYVKRKSGQLHKPWHGSPRGMCTTRVLAVPATERPYSEPYVLNNYLAS